MLDLSRQRTTTMRIEIENKMSVDQLLARVESSGESAELTRGGEVVAELKSRMQEARAREKAAAEGKVLLQKFRANAKKSHKLTVRQLMAQINKSLKEVRKKHAQSGC